MKLQLVSVGEKEPEWVATALNEYNKRLPADFTVDFKQVPLAPRSKNTSVSVAREFEARHLLKNIHSNDYVIALDAGGKQYSSAEFATRLASIRDGGLHISFLVGGPDGLARSVLTSSREVWSLSALTFPHQLARLVLVEQLYRSWAILSNHPYHK